MGDPSRAVTLTFVVVVVAVVAALVAAAFRAGGRRAPLATAAALAAWLTLTAVLAARGALADFASTPPPLLRLVLPSLVAAVIIALSRPGAALARAVPLTWLVGFQGFRVAVELVLARLHHEGIVPVQMTFEGWNFDILTGLSALALAAVARWRPLPRALVVAWSVAGTLLLTNIVAIAVLSMPTPFRAFHDGPANTVVAGFPFVWLPTVLVPAALFGQVLVLRRLCTSQRG